MSRRRRSRQSEAEMAIDPMVDVVFLLLIFFLFSFQVRMIESLYDVQVASLAPSERPPDTPPLKVTLQSRPTERWRPCS